MTANDTAVRLTATARATLDFIKRISSEYILAGQHNYAPVGNKYTRLVSDNVKRTPVIWGSDFSFRAEATAHDRHYHCGPLNLNDPGLPDEHRRMVDVSVESVRERMVRTAMAQYGKGHIITLMWHCPFPAFGDRATFDSVWAMENRPGPAVWDELVTPGTKLNKQWERGADRIAEYLKRFRDADIPVLWRPYHEMNGVWFWWCNQRGERGFKRLWDMMYERYVYVHNLTNLIWVWNANAPRDRPGDEAYAYADYYPTEDYVHVLAADVYRNDYRQSHHDELLELAHGRPIALGEVGEAPSVEILERQPAWSWFMPWGCLVQWRENQAKIPRLYQSRRVLTMEDLRRSDDGTYRIDRQ